VEKTVLRKKRFSTMWKRLFLGKNGSPHCGEDCFEKKTVLHIVEKAISGKNRFSTMWKRLFWEKNGSPQCGKGYFWEKTVLHNVEKAFSGKRTLLSIVEKANNCTSINPSPV
jgi:hypothetical protein